MRNVVHGRFSCSKTFLAGRAGAEAGTYARKTNPNEGEFTA